MSRAIFRSANLIGDALYIQPALAAWVREHEDWEIDLLTLDDHVACLYEGMGLPIRLVFDRMVKEYDYEFDFDVNKAFKLGEEEKLHIVDAYAKMLGVTITETDRLPKYTPPEGETEKGLILLSMFSRSCASREGKPPNKMLSWAHWLPILALLRQYGPIGVLAGAQDNKAHLPVTEDEYYTGLSLETVARLLKDAKLLVTIDNGIGHLAATQGTPTILFYPQCLGMHWIVPPSPKVFVYQMDPVVLSVADSMLMVREGLKRLWRDG